MKTDVYNQKGEITGSVVLPKEIFDVKFNADFRKRLRRFGYLTRDSRMVERKKYGLKKARRAPQWKKR